MGSATQTQKLDFIKRLRPVAKAVESEIGIKADIGLTQAAHESNWGLSKLTLEANNLFGFTGDAWKKQGKPVYEIKTTEFLFPKEGGAPVAQSVLRPFRAYPNLDASYRDWASLMQGTRYARALAAAKAGSLPDFAREVSLAGYATDPAYAGKLIAMGGQVQPLLA